jgi:hypothetical protein
LIRWILSGGSFEGSSRSQNLLRARLRKETIMPMPKFEF